LQALTEGFIGGHIAAHIITSDWLAIAKPASGVSDHLGTPPQGDVATGSTALLFAHLMRWRRLRELSRLQARQ
jgi:hypothetical protein